MRILVTGAKGMVARAVARHCRSIGDEVVALDRTELDIADSANVRAIVEGLSPDAVINCAAFTDVDGSETNVAACFAANADGPENLAVACLEFDSLLITISTDYIFCGDSSGFYTQRDTPDPQGVYARSKLEGEIRAKKANSRTVLVRTGWIYGDGGTNFLSVMHQILGAGKHIKAIEDSYGTPTYAEDLAMRLREYAELDLPCIFHVTNSGPGTSYAGFAESVCQIGGFDRGLVEVVSKESLRRPAPRPDSSKLACLLSERLGLAPMPEWRDALARFINNLG